MTTQTTADIATVDEALADGAPHGRHLYFYFGWASHAAGHSYDERACVDWRQGWAERERRQKPETQTTENEVSGFDCPGAEFEYEERTGLTIILPTGDKGWLCWTEVKCLAGWLVELVLKDSQ